MTTIEMRTKRTKRKKTVAERFSWRSRGRRARWTCTRARTPIATRRRWECSSQTTKTCKHSMTKKERFRKAFVSGRRRSCLRTARTRRRVRRAPSSTPCPPSPPSARTCATRRSARERKARAAQNYTRRRPLHPPRSSRSKRRVSRSASGRACRTCTRSSARARLGGSPFTTRRRPRRTVAEPRFVEP